MQVYIFQSDQEPELFGVTSNTSVPHLPRERGPWALHRIVELEDLAAIDVAQAERDITTAGFHLCQDLERATAP